ncbi:MAG: nitroreductase family protein [bacterium]|nr:nitroreductase family protein [bacterium]
MDAIEALKTRRSIRKYLDRPVSKELIEQLVDVGRLAATANNLQPWEFVVVTDANMRQQLADITEYGKFIKIAPVCILVFSKDTKYFLEDGSAATQNILVAARALGLGSCWVAGDKKPYADKIRELLGVPTGYKLISLIAIGYPAETPEAKNKRPLSSVIHWEKF